MGALATSACNNVSRAVAAEEGQEGVELARLVAIGKRVEEVVPHDLEPMTLFPVAGAVPERRGEVGEGKLVMRGGYL